VTDESDSLQEIFDRALRQKRKRKFDNCRLILEALATSDASRGLTKGEIMDMIRRKAPEYPPGNLTLYLEYLQSEERSAIIRSDSASGKYDYANPFHKVFARLLFTRPDKHPRQPRLPLKSSSLSVERMKTILKILDVTANIARALSM
jgi:hypothetical protein